MKVYLFFAVLGGFLVGARYLLSLFYWGGEGKYGGHYLHGVHNVAAVLTLPLAGLAGFGLGGFAGTARGWSEPIPILCGVMVMLLFVVPWPLLNRLDYHPQVRLDQTLNQTAVVREPIPASHGGAGLVAIGLPTGEVEVRAVTPGGDLSAGASVVVQAILDRQTVEVIPAVDFDQIWHQAMPERSEAGGQP